MAHGYDIQRDPPVWVHWPLRHPVYPPVLSRTLPLMDTSYTVICFTATSRLCNAFLLHFISTVRSYYLLCQYIFNFTVYRPTHILYTYGYAYIIVNYIVRLISNCITESVLPFFKLLNWIQKLMNLLYCAQVSACKIFRRENKQTELFLHTIVKLVAWLT